MSDYISIYEREFCTDWKEATLSYEMFEALCEVEEWDIHEFLDSNQLRDFKQKIEAYYGISIFEERIAEERRRQQKLANERANQTVEAPKPIINIKEESINELSKLQNVSEHINNAIESYITTLKNNKLL